MKTTHKIIGLSILLTFSSFSFIVRRHDVDDQKYLDLAKEFPAVCKVGNPLGDGTYIGNGWVITAAHVAEVLNNYGGPKKAFFGEDSYDISEVIIHPDFVPMRAHDIALVKLEESPEGIEPHGLYIESDETGKEIVIVGHGYAKAGNERQWVSKEGRKRAATNKIERVTSDQIIFNFSHPESTETTALEGTAGAGDSGGPALILKDGQYYIAGISSAGMEGRNGPGTYGAVEHYTRVSTHLEWIRKTIE